MKRKKATAATRGRQGDGAQRQGGGKGKKKGGGGGGGGRGGGGRGGGGGAGRPDTPLRKFKFSIQVGFPSNPRSYKEHFQVVYNDAMGTVVEIAKGLHKGFRVCLPHMREEVAWVLPQPIQARHIFEEPPVIKEPGVVPESDGKMWIPAEDGADTAGQSPGATEQADSPTGRPDSATSERAEAQQASDGGEDDEEESDEEIEFFEYDFDSSDDESDDDPL